MYDDVDNDIPGKDLYWDHQHILQGHNQEDQANPVTMGTVTRLSSFMNFHGSGEVQSAF